MPVCGKCGNEEPDGARFCGNCSAELVEEAASAAALQICSSCGAEEPEGSRFCGTCGAALAQAAQPAVEATAAAAPSPPAGIEQQERLQPPPGASEAGRGGRRWIAAGAAAALLVAGGVLAAVLVLGGGSDDQDVVVTTEPAPPTLTSPEPTVPAPTLGETVEPPLLALAAAQGELNTQVRTLRAGVGSFATLRNAADAVAADIVPVQELLDGLAPKDGLEAATLQALQRALLGHLAYAEAIVALPVQPRSLTAAQAQAAIARAEEAQRTYASLAITDPSLPTVPISGAEHQILLAVASANATPEPAPTQQVVDLVPLLVGPRPDDPPRQGRCFGPYTSRASLRVSGVVHRSGFIQCGDDANGDPRRASGTYRFTGSTGPAGSRLIRLTGQVAIDESSSSSQRGSSVSWTVFYDGRALCSATVVWSGARPSPRALDCRISATADSGGYDLRRLQIQQVASLASSGSFWAGMLDPRIVVVMP